MIKILTVFGTRPEAIKMVPLLLAMEKHPSIQSTVCVTAQHRDLLDQVLAPFHITPQYDLNIMSHGQTLTDITNRILTGLGPILAAEKPHILLVHGDTTTSFAAALAAFYARVKVGHVEAGLRSFDKDNPFPEEVNRKLTTQIADLYFAPTKEAQQNLINEGIAPEYIPITGNTVIDLIAHTAKKDYVFEEPALQQIDFTKRIILMSAHRMENRGQPMVDICNTALKIVNDHPDTFLVWPVHPGEAVKKPATAILGGKERVLLTNPLGVFDMHNLMARAHLLLTDSGGLQEESPSFDLPTIVLRQVTERPEGLKAGTLLLAGTDPTTIYNHATTLLNDPVAYQKMANIPNPFGDGQASQRIIDAILNSNILKGASPC